MLRCGIHYNPFDSKYPSHNGADGHTHTTPLPGLSEVHGDPENGAQEQFWCLGRVPFVRINHRYGKNDRFVVMLYVPIIALALLCYISVEGCDF